MEDILLIGTQTKDEQNHKSKLTETQVLEIKENKNKHSHSELASLYNISCSQVSAIINGKAWKHVS